MNLINLARSLMGRKEFEMPAEGPITLLISGFGWSGSGALIDYAADHAGVGGFRKGFEEGSVLKGLYSLAVFYRGVANGSARTVGDIDKLAEALAGEPGLSDRIDPPRELVNIKRNEQMRRELGGERIDAAVAALAGRLREKVDSTSGEYRGSPADVLAAGTEFLDALKRISCEVRFKEPPRYLVLNNDPPGYSVDLFKFHRAARYTVVTRDLTDVFATLVQLKRIDADDKSLRAFVRAQRKKIVTFEKTLLREQDPVKQNLAVVEFERFVGVESVRAAWHEFTELPQEKVASNFDPSISVRNTGIGEQLPENVYRQVFEGVEAQRRELLERLKKRSDVRVL